jgi:hypothetical protein
VTSSFTPPRRDEIPHVDLTRDVNHDDRDDLVVPDVDGFWVFVQMEGGAFAAPVKIGPATDMSAIYGADGYRYDPWSQARVHEMDYDQDGRSDLVSRNEATSRCISRTNVDCSLRSPRPSRPMWPSTPTISARSPPATCRGGWEAPGVS